MDDVTRWWDIAQLAGAGAAVVLGPVAWMLWGRVQSDIDYVRQADRNTLEVLGQLTRVLETSAAHESDRHTQILSAIGEAVSHIKGHIDATNRSP